MYGYIYRIKDLTNGKCYIGQHKYDKPMLDPKYHGSSHILKNQIKNHPENFLEEIIFIAATLDELNYFETYFIEHMNTLYPNGYNLNTGGNKAVLCEESKQKTSDSLKGQKRAPLSEETKQKISNSLKGENHYYYGKIGPMKGHHHTEETKEKISSSLKGHKHSEEFKKKCSESKKGEKSYQFIKICPLILWKYIVIDNMTYQSIADIFGCHKDTIRNRCKYYKINKHLKNE